MKMKHLKHRRNICQKQSQHILLKAQVYFTVTNDWTSIIKSQRRFNVQSFSFVNNNYRNNIYFVIATAVIIITGNRAFHYLSEA